jgi:hypothetical protein
MCSILAGVASDELSDKRWLMAGRFFRLGLGGCGKEECLSGISTAGGGVSTIFGTGGAGSLVLDRGTPFGDDVRRAFAGADLCLSCVVGAVLEPQLSKEVEDSSACPECHRSSLPFDAEGSATGSVETRSNLNPVLFESEAYSSPSVSAAFDPRFDPTLSPRLRLPFR